MFNPCLYYSTVYQPVSFPYWQQAIPFAPQSSIMSLPVQAYQPPQPGDFYPLPSEPELAVASSHDPKEPENPPSVVSKKSVAENKSETRCRKYHKRPALESNEMVKSGINPGRWTRDEHERFLKALQIYGKNWKQVEEYVGTRTGAQIRSHAQKYFIKVEKLRDRVNSGGNSQEFIEQPKVQSFNAATTKINNKPPEPVVEEGEVRLACPFLEEYLNNQKGTKGQMEIRRKYKKFDDWIETKKEKEKPAINLKVRLVIGSAFQGDSKRREELVNDMNVPVS